MSHTRQMLETERGGFTVEAGLLAATIDALNDCIEDCTVDVDADLGEHNLADMVRCIRLCLHCADVCTATARVASRRAEFDAGVVRPMLEACAAMCTSCGDECERHARMHEHCRVCAESCRRCERACRDLLAALS